jgi:hypothetical protein
MINRDWLPSVDSVLVQMYNSQYVGIPLWRFPLTILCVIADIELWVPTERPAMMRKSERPAHESLEK